MFEVTKGRVIDASKVVMNDKFNEMKNRVEYLQVAIDGSDLEEVASWANKVSKSAKNFEFAYRVCKMLGAK